jgi:2-hydroxychromene-2-carboxylate isomerase
VAISATLYTDPACPWAYSASPALSVLRWRYREQFAWRLVVIVLRESDADLNDGYTPARQARGARLFRDRFGMPIAAQPKARPAATGRACRAIVAARVTQPGREFAVLRALQLAWFNAPELVLDEDAGIERALARVDGLDLKALLGALDSDAVSAAYEADKHEARSAAGGPTEFQGKAAVDGGFVRYTAPSVVFERDGHRLEAGGFQPVEAYDVLVANLDPKLERTPEPDSPQALLDYFPGGLATQEVAALLAGNLENADRAGAEEQLIELAASGQARREPLGGDALWHAAA